MVSGATLGPVLVPPMAASFVLSTSGEPMEEFFWGLTVSAKSLDKHLGIHTNDALKCSVYKRIECMSTNTKSSWLFDDLRMFEGTIQAKELDPSRYSVARRQRSTA